MGFLSGKSKSSNQAYGWANQTYSPMAQTGVQANNVLAGLLGVGGDSDAAQQGYQNFLNSTGYQTTLNNALSGLSGNAALSGQLQSGSTMRAAQDRAVQLGQNSFNNYLSQVGGLATNGMQAGSLITGAGQTSTNKKGLLDSVGSIGQGIAGFAMLSDRRAKTDIRRIGQASDGLGWYSYRYHGEDETRYGTMADEVERLRPWAMGPEINGMQTVRYQQLGAI